MVDRVGPARVRTGRLSQDQPDPHGDGWVPRRHKPAGEVLDGQWTETTVPLAITAEPADTAPADTADAEHR